MRKFLIALVVIPILLVLVCYGCIRVSNPNAGYENIRISKETTYLTEPLDEYGMVDCLEALNQRISQGVTPKNNAAVLFWQAAGPSDIPPKLREEFFGRLGIEELPEEGAYFVSLEDYIEAHPEIEAQLESEIENSKKEKLVAFEKAKEAIGDNVVDLWDEVASDSTEKYLEAMRALDEAQEQTVQELLSEQQGQAGDCPWSTDEFPIIAAWLEANREPLAILEQGTLRERFYSPLVADNRPRVLRTRLLLLQNSREFARALMARSMQKLQTDDTKSAWQDIHTCHRLGRHLGAPPILMNFLVAIAIDGVATNVSLSILQEGTFTVQELQSMRKELNELPPIVSAAECVGLGERIGFIDSTVERSLGNIGQSDLDGENTAAVFSRWSLDNLVDWNQVLIQGNEYYDRLVECMSHDTYPIRHAALEQFDLAFELWVEGKERPADIVKSYLSGAAKTDQIVATSLSLYLPALSEASESETRYLFQLQSLDIAFALELYRLEHQSYPETLTELVPKQFDAVPKDPYTEEELKYRREDNGYLLYSVGQNQKDDGGESWYEDTDLDGDDLVIRFKRDKKTGQ